MNQATVNGGTDSEGNTGDIHQRLIHQQPTGNRKEGNQQQRRIVYTKTSCYFCNEWLDGDSFKVCAVPLITIII